MCSVNSKSRAAGNYEFPEVPYHDGRGYVFPAPCKGSRVLKTSDDTEAYIAEALKSYKKAGCAVGQQPGAFSLSIERAGINP